MSGSARQHGPDRDAKPNRAEALCRVMPRFEDSGPVVHLGHTADSTRSPSQRVPRVACGSGRGAGMLLRFAIRSGQDAPPNQRNIRLGRGLDRPASNAALAESNRRSQKRDHAKCHRGDFVHSSLESSAIARVTPTEPPRACCVGNFLSSQHLHGMSSPPFQRSPYLPPQSGFRSADPTNSRGPR